VIGLGGAFPVCRAGFSLDGSCGRIWFSRAIAPLPRSELHASRWRNDQRRRDEPVDQSGRHRKPILFRRRTRAMAGRVRRISIPAVTTTPRGTAATKMSIWRPLISSLRSLVAFHQNRLISDLSATEPSVHTATNHLAAPSRAQQRGHWRQRKGGDGDDVTHVQARVRQPVQVRSG